MKTLLVTPAPAGSVHFARLLGAKCGEPIMVATECAQALRKVARDTPGLVIVDEDLRQVSPLEFIRQLLALNAFVNVAVISRLSEERFHEVYEGLGVLARLPPRPGRRDALALLARCRQIEASV